MNSVWAGSLSLAATEEVEVSFSSWSYLDVSVRSVRVSSLCIQLEMPCLQTRQVSPFRNPRIKACLAAPRGLSQPRHVFHRFLAPKHPPYTLCSLTTLIPRRGGPGSPLSVLIDPQARGTTSSGRGQPWTTAAENTPGSSYEARAGPWPRSNE